LEEKFSSAWPYKFGLVYSVTLSPDSLTTVLNVRNEGEEKFEFQALLHSYFRVKDVTTTKVTGLAAVEYVDKVLDGKTQTQSTPELTISGEVDRLYSKIPQDTTTIIEGGKPRFDIIRDGVSDTVVWNPWKEKAASMGDFEPKDGYLRLLAVEVGAVSSWIALEGGESWEGGQIVKSLS
jgi:glucose-6-phosphate 1-epimerase